ncbi:MAG: long-chain acyl-CoA synthetase [Psychromonas sp.]|jgi:long-chain acyl-CoA synthetase|uniref:AMP-binding protein n=1 Tax=Psychromonas sp. TaxID=1884585 RepID=UPI0039E232F5
MILTDKAWYKSYPSDVPREINVTEFDNLLALFEHCSEKYSANIAFINMGHSLTYQQLDLKSKAFAAYCQNTLKMQPGERVALMMPNLLQYPIALFGALRAGLVVVNVNPLYTPRELRQQLKDSGATAIVAVTNFGNSLQQVLGDTDIKHIILTSIGDQLAPYKRSLVNFVVKYIKKMVPKYYLPSAISMRRVLTQGALQHYDRPTVLSSDMAFLQYTGGTTGIAKGAVLTHQNIAANVLQVFAHFGPRTLLDKEKAVTPLPLYHIFANTVSMMMLMFMGGQNLLITNPREIKSFVKDLQKYPFTMLFGLNTLFNGLLKNAAFRKLDFSQARIVIAGGMATQKHIATEWEALTGMSIIEGYGLTECSPVVAGGMHTQQTFQANIGVPLPSTDIRIADQNNNPLAADEMGEIQIKGPQVMAGYWQQPQETDNAFTQDGFFKTGDIGQMDAHGIFTLVERKKDMILVSGFNVYPSEVEEIAALHPKIIEAAAIGVADDVSGEKIKLFYVSSSPLSAKEIRSHCKKYLTGYKIPSLFEQREELPKSNVGKILRKDLR